MNYEFKYSTIPSRIALKILLSVASSSSRSVTRKPCSSEQNDEIGNHHRQVERVGVVNPGKGFVGDFVPVVAEAALGHRREIKWSEVRQNARLSE